jgi:hypothetical protein
VNKSVGAPPVEEIKDDTNLQKQADEIADYIFKNLLAESLSTIPTTSKFQPSKDDQPSKTHNEPAIPVEGGVLRDLKAVEDELVKKEVKVDDTTKILDKTTKEKPKEPKDDNIRTANEESTSRSSQEAVLLQTPPPSSPKLSFESALKSSSIQENRIPIEQRDRIQGPTHPLTSSSSSRGGGHNRPDELNTIRTSLSSLVSNNISLTSSVFAIEFASNLLAFLPPPSNFQQVGGGAYDELVLVPDDIIQGITDEDDPPSVQMRYTLLLDATNEALRHIFKPHQQYVLEKLNASNDNNNNNNNSETKSKDLFGKMKFGLSKPRPISPKQLKEKVCANIQEWSGYSERYSENLDTMLIQEVKEDDKAWKEMLSDFTDVKEEVCRLIFDDLVKTELDEGIQRFQSTKTK